MQCDAHNLAAGPDGKCIVCRREGGANVLTPGEKTPRRALGPLLLALALLSGIGAFLYVRSRPPRAPTHDELMAEARRTPITVYMTRTCPVCARARTFLADNQLPYQEKDVDVDSALREQLIAVNPEHTVPTFDIDGAIVVGMSVEAIDAALQASVARRLHP